MLCINTNKNLESISFEVTIKETLYTFEYQKSYLILKTKEEISTQIKQDLASESIGRNDFFKILNHMNSAIREYLKSEI